MDIIIWLGFIIIFAIVEAMTLDLSAIWFSFGVLFAMISTLFTDNIIIQIIIFIIGTVILMIGLKPFAKKMIHTDKERSKTNITDMIIGKIGVVTQEITMDKGEVKVSGKYWSARNFCDKKINEGAKVEILEIKGVKLIVKES